MSERDSTAPRFAGKPNKPHTEFPLFADTANRWAKKIGGTLYSSGPWNDPDGTRKRYLEQKDAMHFRQPRIGVAAPNPLGARVYSVCESLAETFEPWFALVLDPRVEPTNWKTEPAHARLW